MPGPCLGNGSVNTFPQQQTRTQQWHNRGTMFFFCVVRVNELQARRGLELSQLIGGEENTGRLL
jgi:hypothetical protein